jgi:hypothetical protein
MGLQTLKSGTGCCFRKGSSMETLLDTGKLLALTATRVESVYEGRDGKCCCGCAGTHYTDEANKRRILRSMQRAALKEGVEFYGRHASRKAGTRLYIVYVETQAEGMVA